MLCCSKQYADTYEEAQANYYSPDVLHYLCNRKVNSVQAPGLTRNNVELRAQLYKVAQFASNKKVMEMQKCFVVFMICSSGLRALGMTNTIVEDGFMLK